MIVDDDIYIGNLIEKALLKNGYTAVRAYSRTEAVRELTAVYRLHITTED